MNRSEYSIINRKPFLIVCFGDMELTMDGIPPPEFLSDLNNHYQSQCDLLFYVDVRQCWCHKGLNGISNNVAGTQKHLSGLISKRNYQKVIFMGVSAGGYASILFGSLCNATDVIAFTPQTFVTNPVHSLYKDIKPFLNRTTRYTLYGDTSIGDPNDLHHISHCENLRDCPNANVNIITKNNISVKEMRDNGEIKVILDDIINNT